MKHKMSRKNYLTAEITRQPMTITIQSNGNQHIHHHYHLILTRYLYDFATVLLLFDISNNTTTLSANNCTFAIETWENVTTGQKTLLSQR